MAIDINNVGSEFVKSILTLYRSAKYYRDKEILSRTLTDCAIDAGSLIAELATCAEADENEIARKALRKLNKSLFVLRVMGEEGVYPARKIKPINTLGTQIKELLGLYITEQPPAPVPAAVPPIFSANHTVQYQIPESNDGGFDDIYEGEIK